MTRIKRSQSSLLSYSIPRVLDCRPRAPLEAVRRRKSGVLPPIWGDFMPDLYSYHAHGALKVDFSAPSRRRVHIIQPSPLKQAQMIRSVCCSAMTNLSFGSPNTGVQTGTKNIHGYHHWGQHVQDSIPSTVEADDFIHNSLIYTKKYAFYD